MTDPRVIVDNVGFASNESLLSTSESVAKSLLQREGIRNRIEVDKIFTSRLESTHESNLDSDPKGIESFGSHDNYTSCCLLVSSLFLPVCGALSASPLARGLQGSILGSS
jgi:hypothetical protein